MEVLKGSRVVESMFFRWIIKTDFIVMPQMHFIVAKL